MLCPSGLIAGAGCCTTRSQKASQPAFRCSLTGIASDRWLEMPAWMFDRATSQSGNSGLLRLRRSRPGELGDSAERRGGGSRQAIGTARFGRSIGLPHGNSGRRPCHVDRHPATWCRKHDTTVPGTCNRRKPRGDWRVLKLGAHEGYVSWRSLNRGPRGPIARRPHGLASAGDKSPRYVSS